MPAGGKHQPGHCGRAWLGTQDGEHSIWEPLLPQAHDPKSSLAPAKPGYFSPTQWTLPQLPCSSPYTIPISFPNALLSQTLTYWIPSSKRSSMAPSCWQPATMTLPQSEFGPGSNTWLPKNLQLGEAGGAAAAAERGHQSDNTNTFLLSFRMNDKIRAHFVELGSSHVSNLGFRDNWIFLGAKGLKNKSPFEVVRGPPLPPAPEAPILFVAPPEPHVTYLSAEDVGQWCYPHIKPSCKFCYTANLHYATSLLILFFPSLFSPAAHQK